MNQAKRYCSKPFSHMEVVGTDIFLCCPSWLKTSVGNIDQNNITDIWNSEKAQAIRESIIDGSYRYCDKEICPYLKSSRLDTLETLPEKVREMIVNKETKISEKPKYVLLSYDFSCNLSCPSCRSQKIMAPLGTPEYKKSEEITAKVHESFIKPNSEETVVLNITGSGDPFASNVYRNYLENLEGDKLPHLKIDLQTNGLLFTQKMWERMARIHGNIRNVFVSIDAATEKTYPIVRREGNWSVLISNMKFLADLRRQKKLNLLQARFVVQKENYVEMEEFARSFLKRGCDVIEFALLVDWQSWTPQKFHDQCVWEKGHPEREKFLKSLSKSFLSHERVFLGNLTDLREEAIQHQLKTLAPIQRLQFILAHKKQKLINLLVRTKIKFRKVSVKSKQNHAVKSSRSLAHL
jgi:MoaA/NifB/PqqE/SkfB family radical SAM enzyme